MTTSRCMADAGAGFAGARRGLRGWRSVAPLVAAIAWLADDWHRGQAIRALQDLDDRQLRDMGIERGQIEIVAEALIAAERRQRRRSL